MEERLPTIIFTDTGSEETKTLYVLEETSLAGRKYLLVTDAPEGDAEAFIFREDGEDEENITYGPVEDDREYEVIAKLFEELLDDTEFARE